MAESQFPTAFAKIILEDAELYPREELHKITDRAEKNEAIQKIGLAQNFQQMCLYCTFEEAKIVYRSLKLDAEQLEALETIHKITKNWALGHIGDVLISRLSGDARYTAPIADLLLSSLQGEDQTAIFGKVKQLVVKVREKYNPADVPETTVDPEASSEE